MEQFLGFALPGIPYGCTYAIFAIGLVLTYQATGVFNFAFAAQAYTSAYLFAFLCTNEHMTEWLAFVISVVIVAPGLGLVFNYFLFRHIPNTNTTAKVVVGISLLVGVPSLLTVIFGSQNLYPPNILFNPNTTYFHVFGLKNAPFDGIELSTVIVTAAVLVFTMGLLRFTSLGLKMRAAVESRRLVQLDGVNAGAVVASAWAISSFLAGLAGVLLAVQAAPVTPQNYYLLVVAAVAAAACASLRSIPIAAGVAVLLGVVEQIALSYLPTSGILYDSVLPAFPFIVLALALLFIPGMRRLDESPDPLAAVDPPTPPITSTVRAPTMDRIIKVAWYVLLAAFVISMFTWMPVTWEGVFNQGIALSVIFLSITLITGMGGQLSLAQGSLAGVGGFTAGQLANHLGLNLLVGGLIGAVAAAAVAVVLALLSLRLRGLGLALMTLAAALFFDNAVFSQSAVSGSQSGLSLLSWLGLGLQNPNGHSFFVLGMLVLALCTAIVLQVRKGTIGRYLAAMRGSEVGAAAIGINPMRQRVIVFALAGAIAGIGGALYSVQQLTVVNTNFNTEFDLVFIVIVVTTGVTTVEGAIQAGIGFGVVQQLLTYLPHRFGGNSLLFVLFAFGSLTYASHPEGVLEYQKRRWTGRFERAFFGRNAEMAVADSRSAASASADRLDSGRKYNA